MSKIKACTKANIIRQIKKRPDIGEDILNDHNNIEFLMKTGHMFRIFKLITIIVNTSYFVGIIFYIISDINVKIASSDSK